MRTKRVIASITLVTLAVGAPAALGATKHKPVKAKPKPVCNLVTDPANDSGPVGNATGQGYDPSLDITSADIASDGKTVTAVVRVKKLSPPTSDTTSPLGRRWNFSAQVAGAGGGGTIGFIVDDGPLGPTFSRGTGVIDYTHNEVRISVPTSAFSTRLAVGTVLTTLTASTDTTVQMSPATGTNAFVPPGGQEDDASAPATRTYVIGTPSCVAVGK